MKVISVLVPGLRPADGTQKVLYIPGTIGRWSPTIGNYPKRQLSELPCSELRPRLWLASAIALLIRTLVPAEVFFSFSNWGEDTFFSTFSSGPILNEIGSVRTQNSLAALNCVGLVSNNVFSSMFLKFSVNYFNFCSELVPLPGSCFALLFWEFVGLWCHFQIVCVWHLGRHLKTVMFW